MFPDFFVVGVPRSGTTLARAIIDGHSQLVVPSETGFLPRLLRLQRVWWNGRSVRLQVFLRLVFANGRLTRAGLTRDQVRARLRGTPAGTPAEAISRIYECFAAGDTGLRVGDKTPSYIEHAGVLGAAFEHAKFLHVVRHPLSVAASLRQQTWGPDDPVASGALWVRSVRTIAQAGLPPDRLMTLRLEDLIAEPMAAVNALARFLGVTPEPQMLQFSDRAERITRQNVHPHGHAGLHDPLRQTRHWQSELDARLAADTWSIVKDEAERFGYAGPQSGLSSVTVSEAQRRLRHFQIRRSWRRLRTVARFIRQ